MKQTSIILMSDTSDIINKTGQAFRGAGYYGFNSGLHTVGLYLNRFIGRIYIQGSFETNPEESDWFNVDFQNNGEEYKEYPIFPERPTEEEIVRNEVDYLLNCNNVNQQNIIINDTIADENKQDIEETVVAVGINQTNDTVLKTDTTRNIANIQRLSDGDPIDPPLPNPLSPIGILPEIRDDIPLIGNPIFTPLPIPTRDEYFTGVEMFSFEGNYIWLRAKLDRSYLPESMYTYNTGGKAIKTDRIGNIRQVLLNY